MNLRDSDFVLLLEGGEVPMPVLSAVVLHTQVWADRLQRAQEMLEQRHTENHIAGVLGLITEDQMVETCEKLHSLQEQCDQYVDRAISSVWN